eukprot:COSAG01_NODE_6360_length_3713_cov_3.531821_2_plen_156_part_00
MLFCILSEPCNVCVVAAAVTALATLARRLDTAANSGGFGGGSFSAPLKPLLKMRRLKGLSAAAVVRTANIKDVERALGSDWTSSASLLDAGAMGHRDEEEQVQGEALQTEPAPESTGEGGGGDEEAPAAPFNPFALLGGESSDDSSDETADEGTD